MQIFICEYITGGGLQNEDLLRGLTREGTMMRDALVRDLSAALPDGSGEIIVSCDPRLAPPSLPACFVSSEDGEDIWAFWERHMGKADALWPIAPETQGAMERLCAMAKRKGLVLLASDPETIRVTASKRATAGALSRGGVAVVPVHGAGEELPPSPGGWVVKPDDGAGAEDTRYFLNLEEARDWLVERPGYIAQPYLEGEVASLSLLCRDGAAGLLSCNRQIVTIADGEIRLEAIEVGGIEEQREAFSALAQDIAALFPGLWGYNGIDVICGKEGITVLEINPRLTTSYVGLGESLGVNPAGMVLGLLEAGPVPTCIPKKTVTIELTEMAEVAPIEMVHE